jgi:hypothetical protein
LSHAFANSRHKDAKHTETVGATMISHDFIEDGSGIFFASIKSNVPPPTPAIFEVLLFLILVDLLVELESLVKGVSTLWLFT